MAREQPLAYRSVGVCDVAALSQQQRPCGLTLDRVGSSQCQDNIQFTWHSIRQHGVVTCVYSRPTAKGADSELPVNKFARSRASPSVAVSRRNSCNTTGIW